MSRFKVLGPVALTAALVVGAGACSDDGGSDATSDRGEVTFAAPMEGSTELGLCSAYDIAEMKELVGGEETFKQLKPTPIGVEGDSVTGETCAWERVEPNGDSLSLRVEVRDFGDDQATLTESFETLQESTLEAEPLLLGEGAFTSVSDETSLLQVRSGPYVFTLASRATGDLEPVDLEAMQQLAAAGIEQLS